MRPENRTIIDSAYNLRNKVTEHKTMFLADTFVMEIEKRIAYDEKLYPVRYKYPTLYQMNKNDLSGYLTHLKRIADNQRGFYNRICFH